MDALNAEDTQACGAYASSIFEHLRDAEVRGGDLNGWVPQLTMLWTPFSRAMAGSQHAPCRSWVSPESLLFNEGPVQPLG